MQQPCLCQPCVSPCVFSLPHLTEQCLLCKQHYVTAHSSNRPRVSVSFNVRVTYPDDAEGESEAYSVHSASSSSTVDAARITFIVPQHHQSGFLDGRAAKDMVVGG